MGRGQRVEAGRGLRGFIPEWQGPDLEILDCIELLGAIRYSR